MRIFDFMYRPNIDQGVAECRSIPEALLLDVRNPEEYQEHRIPGSKNVPLQQLDKVGKVAQNKDIPLYIYCHSGVRSRRASLLLEQMGYTNVHNIGGIAAYSGKVES